MIDEAKKNMILSRDIVNEMNGTSILSKGTVLNEKLIDRIKHLGVRDFYIVDDSQYLLARERKMYDRTEIFMESHAKLTDKTRKVFENIKIGKKVLLTEITREADEVINELYKSDNILSRLRQIEEDDDYTFKHSINVSILAAMVGKWFNFPKNEIKQLFLAGLFHDIGKLKISTDIINKPGKLNEKETEIIKKHPVYGYDILSNTIGISKNVLMAVLQHHEREDGSGYPRGIKSKEIHKFAKIIAVCDVFDAMTSTRVYKEKMSPFKVAEQIANDSFGVLNPEVAVVFLKNISNYYVGNLVQLSNGEIGEIVYVYKTDPTRPLIKAGNMFYDLLKERSIQIVDVLE